MFGFGAKVAIDSIGNIIEKTGGALDRLFTSDDERLSHKEIMMRIEQAPDKWAHSLNMINAKDSNWFNSGWRPAIGWVLAISALLYFVPKFIISAYVWASVCLQNNALVDYPITFGELGVLASMMLGSKVIRSFDKAKGTSSK